MVYDSKWRPLAHCSYNTPGLKIPGGVHSGDIVSVPFPDGARETCVVNFAELRDGFPDARYVVLAVYSFSRQKWDDLEDASVFIANPHARGSGPGGTAVLAAARLTGAATISIADYLDIAATPAAPAAAGSGGDDTPMKNKKFLGPGGGIEAGPAAVFGVRRVPRVVDRENEKDLAGSTAPHARDVWAYFVFTDQEVRIEQGGHCAQASIDAVGRILSQIEESRKKTGAQTLADAAAFQVALVCYGVNIIAEEEAGGGRSNHGSGSGGAPGKDSSSGERDSWTSTLVRGDGESRLLRANSCGAWGGQSRRSGGSEV